MIVKIIVASRMDRLIEALGIGSHSPDSARSQVDLDRPAYPCSTKLISRHPMRPNGDCLSAEQRASRRSLLNAISLASCCSFLR